ncbi:hypothetical protein NDU88_003743 [Pleurodeles waltl]|uniref:Uncharacterized protein n=1 Tax=Pleurodeles waltl TaxID=8319 RepID=A0AAV7WTX4_PLEWA|nr:hypothetical protein NDU88_003743 [Pleurodeles waltl]
MGRNTHSGKLPLSWYVAGHQHADWRRGNTGDQNGGTALEISLDLGLFWRSLEPTLFNAQPAGRLGLRAPEGDGGLGHVPRQTRDMSQLK